ncbi:MAG: hypothetical protein ACP5E8_05750 [Thermoplasmata archaeon]
MPNPYVDSLKIAKELENKAKEFQKKKKSVEEGLERLSKIMESLKKFGLEENIEETRKKIEDLLKERNVDDADKLLNELSESLEKIWNNFYSNELRKIFESMKKEMGEFYADFFKKILSEDNNRFDLDSIESTLKTIEILDSVIREKLGREKIENYSNIIETLEEDINSILKRREEINSKLKDILLKISQFELYAYKNKVDIAGIEKSKKEAISLFRQDNFDKTIKMLEDYSEVLQDHIKKSISKRIDNIENLFEKGKVLDVNLDEFRESFEKTKNEIYNSDINQTSESLRKMEQLIDRKLFDETISKLSKLNNDIKDIYGDTIPDHISESIKKIRESIKENDLESAYKNIRDVKQQIETEKGLQSSLRERLSVLKENLSSIPFKDEEKSKITGEINALLSSKIIENDKVEKLEREIEKEIMKQINNYYSDINDAIILVKKYRKIDLSSYKIDISRRDIETLRKLSDIRSEEIKYLKEIAQEIEQKLKTKGKYMKCSDGDDISSLIKSINGCIAEYQKIMISNFDDYKKILSSYNDFLEYIGLHIPKIRKLIQIIEKHPEKNAEIVIFSAENAIQHLRKVAETIITNYNLLKKDNGLKESQKDEEIIKMANFAMNDLDSVMADKKVEMQKKAFEIILKDLNIYRESIQNGPDTNPLNLLNRESIIRLKIDDIYKVLSDLKWYEQYKGKDDDKINSYQVLKDHVVNAIRRFYGDHPELASNGNLVEDIVCLRDVKTITDDNSKPIEFSEIANERIIRDLSIFYNISDAQNEESINNVLRERTRKILKDIKSKKSSATLNMAAGRIESYINERPREAYISALALYDENIEKGYLRKEVNGMITRIRAVTNEYGQEIPWFQDEFKKIAGMMVIGDYVKALDNLSEIIIKASKDLPYLKYLRENLSTLNNEMDILEEEDKKNLLEIKRMIMEYKFREAYDGIRNISEKVKRKKGESELKKLEDKVEMISSNTIINLFNGTKCELMDDGKDIETILSNYQTRYLIAKMEEIKNLNDALETNIDLDGITIKNANEIGIFLFNLKANLIVKISEKISEIIDNFTVNAKLVIITQIFQKYLENMNKIIETLSIAEFYSEIKARNTELLGFVKQWAEDVTEGSLNVENLRMEIDAIIKEAEIHHLENNIQVPNLYNPEEIERRIEFLEKMGYKVERNSELDSIINEIESISGKFITSLDTKVFPTNLRKSQGFVVECHIKNNGTAPLFDVTVAFNGIISKAGNIYPGESKEILVKHENSEPEMLIISGTTINWKDYMINWEIPPVVKYIKYVEKYKEGCVYCRGVILPGIEALKCNFCGTTYHLKCAQRSKKCIVCGNDFGLQ